MTKVRKTDFICPKCLNTNMFWDGEDMVECDHVEDEVEFFDDFYDPNCGDWINDLDDEEFGTLDSD